MFELAVRGITKNDPTLLRLRLMGNMEARTLNGDSVLPIGGKTKGLLAILALSDRKPVPRTRLAELLWSRRPDDLARASLRQEIHRLLDALSPLGVDVIDVQRHTLALKPALTSVDVERFLNGSLNMLRDLPPASEVLLGDIGGLDPAFNDWVHEQREQLTRHIHQQFEHALRTWQDPDLVLETAERLLRRDELNELAWRTRIQAWINMREYAQANKCADDMIRLFGEQTGALPPPSTMDIITALRERSGDGYGGVENAFEPATVEPEQELTENTRKVIAETIAHVPESTPVGRMAQPQFLGSIAVAPFQATGSARAKAAAIDLSEQCDIGLVGLNVLNVLPFPSYDTDDNPIPFVKLRRQGIDFLVSGFVRDGLTAPDRTASAGHLIVRLLDLRHDGNVIWADRFALPEAEDRNRALLFYVMSSIQWALFTLEGQRVAGRPVSEITSLQLSVRALTLLLRCDRALFVEIEELASRAMALDPAHPIVLLTRTLVLFCASSENWRDYSEEEVMETIAMTSSIATTLRANPLGLWLAMSLKTFVPGQLDQAKALMTEFTGETSPFPSYSVSPVMHGLRSFQALLSGDRKTALEEIQRFRELRTSQPVSVLLEPFSFYVLFACGSEDEARQAAAAFTSLYPRCGRALLYYLVILTAQERQKEADAILQQVMRLAPSHNVHNLMTRHLFLPQDMQDQLRDLLLRAGLPAT